MSLEGVDVLKPVVKIDVIGGPATLTGAMLESHLMKFQYISKQGKGSFPKITLELDNSEGNMFNFAILAIGLKLKVRWGYAGHMAKPFVAEVKSVRCLSLAYPSGQGLGSPRPDAYGTVVMEAMAHQWPLHWRPQTDVWSSPGPCTAAASIKAIARSYGYSDKQLFIQEDLDYGRIEGPAAPILNSMQILETETFAQYLRRLAKDNGFYTSVSDKEVHFHRKGWGLKTCEEITYFVGPDVLSFNIQGDYTMNVNKVTSKSFNPKTGVVMVTDAFGRGTGSSYITDSPISGGSSGGGLGSAAAAGKTPESLSPTDIVSSISTKAAAATMRRLTSHIENKWKLELTVVGNPVIFEGLGITLENFGPVVDGTWVTTEVEHRVDTDGYTTRIGLSARRTAKSGSKPAFTRVFVLDEYGRAIGTHAIVAGSWKSRGKSGELKGYCKQKKGKGSAKGHLRKPAKPLTANRTPRATLSYTTTAKSPAHRSSRSPGGS